MNTVGKYLWICVHLLILTLVTSLHVSITEDLVSVQNGSSEVILDCPFELNTTDKKNLVIKWFYGDDVSQIYQWIPERQNNPQVIGILKERIDVEHNVTNDRFTSHRALYIRDPSIDLNGKYTCYVSTFEEDALIEVQLTVYIPPTTFGIDYHNPDEDTVTFVCKAEDVYPEPELELYYKHPNEEKKMDISNSNVSVIFDDDTQTYNATIYKTFTHADLNISNYIGCQFHLMETDYNLDAGLVYLTGPLPSVSPSPDLLHTAGDDFTEESNVSSGVKVGYSLFLYMMWCVVFLQR